MRPHAPPPPPPKSEGILDKLGRLGCLVETNEQDGTLRVNVTRRAKFNEDIVAALAALENLGSLDLRGCSITSRDIEPLAKNPKLVDVNLAMPAITDEEVKAVAKLPRLRSLDLSDTQVTDAGVACLKGHAALRELNLEMTRVGNAGIEALSGNENLNVAEHLLHPRRRRRNGPSGKTSPPAQIATAPKDHK